jgi:hypothetical protein
LICPYCEEYADAAVQQADEEDDEQTRDVADESGFDDLQEFQEHLEWQHTQVSLPVAIPTVSSNCRVM